MAAESHAARTQLAEDMPPFTYQIESGSVHSLGAIVVRCVRALARCRQWSSARRASHDVFGCTCRQTVATLEAISLHDAERVCRCRDMKFVIDERLMRTSPPTISCCRSRSRISISTRGPPTTSCARKDCRSRSAISPGDAADQGRPLIHGMPADRSAGTRCMRPSRCSRFSLPNDSTLHAMHDRNTPRCPLKPSTRLDRHQHCIDMTPGHTLSVARKLSNAHFTERADECAVYVEMLLA